MDGDVGDEDPVAAAVDAAFPNREVAAVEAAGVSWNETNETVRVGFGDGDTAYLKIAVDGDGTKITRERGVVAFVRANLPLPAPAVLASDPMYDPPYLATAPLKGRPLHEVRADRDDDGRNELARRVGRALATLHSERFADHGYVVDGDAEGLDLDPAPWPDVLLETIETLQARGPSDRFDGYFEKGIRVVESNRELLEKAPAALLHGDPAGPNTFLTGDTLGFIDWEVAHAGDPGWELVRGADQQFGTVRGDLPEDRCAAFYDGYREVAGDLPEGFTDRRPIYEAAWFLTRISYFDNYLALVDADAADLAADVRAEIERRLDAAR